MKAAKTRRRAEPEAETPVTPLPPARDDVDRLLTEALDWLEGTREVIEELTWTAQDATGAHAKTGRPTLTRETLRRSAAEEGLEALRLVSFTRRAILAARGAR